jgi:hypothetical protein
MALRHFLVTIPLNTVLLTLFFYYIVPLLGLTFELYQMLTIILGVNMATTIIALLLVKDGKGKRASIRGSPQ